MASIQELIQRKKGTAGSGGSWHVFQVTLEDGVVVNELWHYAHKMLVWRDSDPHDPNYLDYSTGWGSVSDQGGMNRAFRALNLPYRYDRQGGARITRLEHADA